MIETSSENLAPSDTAQGEKANPVNSAKKTASPKQEKPPTVESKPFVDFIQQDYLPALTQVLADRGVTDLHVALERSKIAVKGFETAPECSPS